MENKYFRGHWIGHFHELSEQEIKILSTEILNMKNPTMEIFSYIYMYMYGFKKYAEKIHFGFD